MNMKEILLAKDARASVAIKIVREQAYADFEKRLAPRVSNWLKTREFKGKAGNHCVIPNEDGSMREILAVLSDKVSLWDIADMPYKLPVGDYHIEGKLDEAGVEKLALGWLLGAYKMTRYKKAERQPARLSLSGKGDIKAILAMAETTALVRDLINTPAADMMPSDIAAVITNIAKDHGAKTTQIVGDDLLKKGYGGIHAVGRAAANPPRLIDLTWGKSTHPRVTIVGKGVCFDSGGLDIKPSSGMLTMKKDMAGAACAIGLASLIMSRKMPVQLRLLVPTAENAIAGNAYRPGDILTMKNGTTVEITNTDAEGRLLLADALTVGCDEKPDLLIDFATLTGAARVALGTEITAFFTHDDKLAHQLAGFGEAEEDPMWRLPLYKPYASQLDSKIADVANASSGGYGGAISAALFLDRFVNKETKWVHMDFMASNVSAKPGRPEGGEAMALRAAYRLVEDLADKAKAKKHR